MVEEEMGDGMQCVKHPFTKNPGGICAFCLQEKLGKLVTSSSFPLPKHLSSSSSSSSPSFRSDSLPTTTTVTNNNLPFLLAKKNMLTTSSSNIVYKRSQSTRTYGDPDFSPRKRNGFWSFLHLSSSRHNHNKKVGSFHDSSSRPPTSQALSKTEGSSSSSASSSSSSFSNKRVVTGSSNRNAIDVIVEEDGSPVASTVTPSERKVSRSRSVGCGSRSFSGDFFERITNGFGDCTLRRVESQREGNNNNNNNNKAKVSNSSNPSNGVREMVRCGGIFGGFMIMTSSSSSSSSSSWVSSSSSTEQQHHNNGGRNRSWGWAFASPMRAFTSSSSGKRGRTISGPRSNNTTPNLNAIPSLLAVTS